MKKCIIFLAILVISFCSIAQQQLHDYPIEAVPLNQVHLTDNFWLPRIKTVQQTTIAYGFEKCEEEGRMENFLIAGGKMQGKTRGKMPFDDTDVYKIIEGASNSLISYPNPELSAYLDSVIAIIKIGQEPDGYLTTWISIDSLRPPAEWAKPGPRWVNEITNHELYNAGHLYEAAAVHYQATGKRNFLDIALKNADLLVRTFGDGKSQLHIPPGHQIVETGLIKLYRVTGKEDYLKLAKYFLDLRGDSSTHKLYGEYNQDHLPVTQQKEVVGHAVRAVYMYAGMTDIAAIYQDKAYLDAVMALWDNMMNKKMYITGGIGAKHEGEAFGANYELPNRTAYNETCAAIGDVYWNQRLFQLTGDGKYIDVIERTLYNGLIAGISLDGKSFFYPNPLSADGHYGFNQGHTTRAPWFDCSCCPTNLVRFIPSLPGLLYATKESDVYVNLYASDNATINFKKQSLKITQQTDYPWKGAVNIVLEPSRSMELALHLRIPGWARNEVMPSSLYQFVSNQTAPVKITVNDEEVPVEIEKGYAVIKRKWNKGDKIQLELPMQTRQVMAVNEVKADQNRLSVERGPIVYCAEEQDNDVDVLTSSIPKAETFTDVYKPDRFDGIVELSTKLPGTQKPFVLIPYYAWSHRGTGEMEVWFLEEGR